MQRLFYSFLSLLLFIIALLIAYPLFIDKEGYKQEIIQIVKEKTGLDASIDGDVLVSFFPKPRVEVNQLKIANIKGATNPHLAIIPTMEVASTLDSLLQGSVAVDQVAFYQPTFMIERLEDGGHSLQSVVKHLKEKSSDAMPAKVSIYNGLVFYQHLNKEHNVERVNLTLGIDPDSQNHTVTGQVDYKANTIAISGHKDTQGAKIQFDNKAFSLGYEGELTDKEKTSGELRLRIKDVGRFTELFFTDHRLLANLSTKESLEFTGKVTLHPDQLSISEFLVVEDMVKGTIAVNAFFPKTLGQSINWEVSMNIEHVDIDKLTKQESEDETQVQNYFMPSSTGLLDYRFDISKNLNASLDIDIDRVHWKGRDIKDIRVDMDFFSGNAILHELSALFPGQSNIKISGNVEHNGIRPLLTGGIRASGKSLLEMGQWLWGMHDMPDGILSDYRFSSDITMTPRKISLSDIQFNVDETVLSGSIVTRPANKIPTTKINMSLENVNMDDYRLPKTIRDWVVHFARHVKEQNLDTSWLRMLNSRWDVVVNAKQVMFNKHLLNHVALGGSVSSGRLNLQRFRVSSAKSHADIRALIDIKSEPPVLNIDVDSKGFDASLLNISDDKEPDVTTFAWSDKPFNFMGLHRFNGKINLDADHVRFQETWLRNVDIQGEFERNIFHIKQCNADMNNDGKINIRGSMDISNNASVALSFALSKIDIKQLFALFGHKSHIRGQGYLSGTVRSFGNTPKKWISELQLATRLNGRNIEVDGIDLHRIIAKSRELYSVIDMDALIKKSRSGGTTLFSSISGDLVSESGFLTAKKFQLNTKDSRGVLVATLDPKRLVFKSIAKIAYKPEYGKNVVLDLNSKGSWFGPYETSLDTTQLENYITSKAVR